MVGHSSAALTWPRVVRRGSLGHRLRDAGRRQVCVASLNIVPTHGLERCGAGDQGQGARDRETGSRSNAADWAQRTGVASSHDLPASAVVSAGLEGIALLRAWAGDFDQDFVDARLAEVRALLEDPRLALHPGVEVWRGDVDTGYRQWADSYDEPNGLFDIESP